MKCYVQASPAFRRSAFRRSAFRPISSCFHDFPRAAFSLNRVGVILLYLCIYIYSVLFSFRTHSQVIYIYSALFTFFRRPKWIFKLKKDWVPHFDDFRFSTVLWSLTCRISGGRLYMDFRLRIEVRVQFRANQCVSSVLFNDHLSFSLVARRFVRWLKRHLQRRDRHFSVSCACCVCVPALVLLCGRT